MKNLHPGKLAVPIGVLAVAGWASAPKGARSQLSADVQAVAAQPLR